MGCNAALLLHRDGRPPDEVQRYIERYSLRTPKEAAQTMRFIQNPLFRSYIFNYALGKALLAPLLEGADGTANFFRLLSEPFTPTQVRAWLAERARQTKTETGRETVPPRLAFRPMRPALALWSVGPSNP